MTNSNTLERWRPHPLVYLNCALTTILLGIAFSWGIAFLVARWYPDQSTLEVALVGAALFVAVFLWALRRCSTPVLPAFRGLLLITGCMTIGVGSFFLLLVIPAVAFAIVSTVAIALMSLLRKDSAYAPNHFRQLVGLYRRHRMYQ
jgi:hypothetical protein